MKKSSDKADTIRILYLMNKIRGNRRVNLED